MRLKFTCGRCGGTGKAHPLSLEPECAYCKGKKTLTYSKPWIVVTRLNEFVSEHATEKAAKQTIAKLTRGCSRFTQATAFSVVENVH